MLATNPPAPQLHDIKIKRVKKYECARVEGVPPEEFGIGRNDRSIRGAGYCFHTVRRRQGDLISEGFDAAQIKKLPSYTETATQESTSRDTVDEGSSVEGDDGINRSNRLIEITEHYVRMDYKGDNKPCLYRVTTGGEECTILKKDGEDSIVKEDMPCFAAMTPIIVTHRFFGKSIADLVMDIQRQKTALVRGLLDNMYMSLNPQKEVAESHATENTLDDLLVLRQGGIVRTKMPGGVTPLVHPDVSGGIYPGIQYLDATREWRTGVTRQGQGLDANALQNQSATAANQLFTAAQARIKLIARIFAETGIRDLFSLLHATIRKNGSVAQTVRLRNQWVQVDPRAWKSRSDMTIEVGLGTGGKEQQLVGAQLLIGAQEKAIAAGLVSKKNLFNSAKMLTKLLGHKDVDEFFTPPGKEPDPNDPDSAPLPPPENPDIAKAKMEFELKNQEAKNRDALENKQAQADIATNELKTNAEMARDDKKALQESQQSANEHMYRMAEMKLKLVSALATAASKPKPGAVVAGEDGAAVQTNEPGVDINEIIAQIGPLLSQPAQPRGMKVVRDAHGRVSHTEPL